MKYFNPQLSLIFCISLFVSSAFESTAACRKDTINYYEFQNGTFNKVLTQKVVSTFNAANLPTKELTQDWDSVGEKWIDYKQVDLVYDNEGNLLSETKQSWWPNISEWVNSYRETNTYNSMNLRLTNTSQFHDNTAWVNDTRISQKYDENGNETEYKKEEWSTSSSEWENQSKSIRTWDSNNRQLTSISQTWDDTENKWVNRTRYQPSYDANENWILGFRELWDENTGKWVNQRKNELTYDGNNNRLTNERLLWDENTSKWISSTKYTYTYADNKRTTELYENWINNTWVKINRYTYSYDGENVAGYIKENWENNAWVNISKNSSAYNMQGQITEVQTQTWKTDKWVNSSKSITIYNSDNDISGREQYYAWQTSGMYYGGFSGQYYSCTTYFSTVATMEDEGKIVMYPNPTNRYLTIESEQPIALIEMYDLNGQQLLQTDVNKLDLSQFEAGMYLIKVQTSLGTSVKRIQLYR